MGDHNEMHHPGIEPGTPAWKADMLATTPMMRWRLETSLFMHEVGFEPTKRFALDLKSSPFDQTRVPMLIVLVFNDKILFLTELLTAISRLLLLGSNQRPVG